MRHSCRVSDRLEQGDWDELRAAAVEAMGRAYAPYSGYPVGAAALVDDGRVVVGCNVENAAYGVALCAECGLVSQLHASGGGRLTHFVCVNGAGEVIMPCGRCRQLLHEHGGRDLLLWTVSGVKPMSEVLPDAFGPEDLAAVAPAALETLDPAGDAAPRDPEGTP
ncbi:cytidine deaminase [Nocardioides xinjiangensis]|uniref:cytidine deaminase n=1 Tax=Nocardioides xinjiangensis TaxID=2817376 RepID=UPI001B307935|nr:MULTISPECIES: cytidine deaminase [unclassified Nocardioides]